MRERGLQIALFMLLALGTARTAAAQGISVTVDRREVTVQDQIVLQVTVEGSQAAQPRLPEMPDFDVFSRGQASQMQIVNGRATSSIVYHYLLAPKNLGTFTIGAATVDIDGRTYSSRPFTIRVLEAAARPQDSGDAYLSVSVSSESPYVGEQVIFTWRFFRRVQVAGANLESLEFPGFLVEDLGEVREYQTVADGQQYVVSEFRKALFPQEDGTLTIPPSVLNCEVVVRDQSRRRSVFDDFFGRAQTQARVLRSRPVELQVRPLPSPPAGFRGLVGQFDLSTHVSKARVQVGESITLSVSVSGTGNVRSISEPAWPELSSFKVYADRPSSSINAKGNALTGRTTFTKALVPLEAGQLTIPQLTLTYFDPREGKYRTERAGPFTLEVAPGEGGEELRLTESIAPTTGKVAVRILADDILPISRGLEAVEPPARLLRSPVSLMGLLLAPPFVVLFLTITERRRRRFELDSGLRRRSKALGNARRALRGLEGEGAELARSGSRVLRAYVGDKLGVEGTALTPAEIVQSLDDRGVDDNLVGRVRDTFDHLEGAQFGAARVERAGLESTLDELISLLERELGSRTA